MSPRELLAAHRDAVDLVDYAADEAVSVMSRLTLALYLAGRRQDADHYRAASPHDREPRLDLATLARHAAPRRK